MKIIELKSENVKRLKAVHIQPSGALVQITGRNAQGKSSVLDSIAMLLGGLDNVPAQPIRRGQAKAQIVAKLDDIVVERTFTESGSTLTVRSLEGAKYPKPQAILDKLVGPISFDPLAFSRMEPRKQLETLKSLVGIDFSKLDTERAELYDKRTVVNRDAKAMESRLASAPEYPDAPTTEVSVAELAEKLNEACRVNSAIADRENRIDAERSEIARIEADIKRHEESIAKLKVAAQACEKNIGELVIQKNRLTAVDTDSLRKQLSEAESLNRKARENAFRSKLAREHRELVKQSELLTSDIVSIDTEKTNTLAAAKFPVAGLAFDDSGVTYNELPLEQASSAEQLRVSVAIGLAMNPKLRVILIRDGSLLDADGLQMIAEMAEAQDAQVWIERVSDGEQVGIVIEDGMVAAEVAA